MPLLLAHFLSFLTLSLSALKDFSKIPLGFSSFLLVCIRKAFHNRNGKFFFLAFHFWPETFQKSGGNFIFFGTRGLINITSRGEKGFFTWRSKNVIHKDDNSRTRGSKKYPTQITRQGKKILGIREGSRNLMTLLLFVPFLSGNFLSFLPFFLSLFQLGFFAKRKPERQNFPRSGDTRIWEQGKGSFGRNWEARPPLCWQIAKTLDWTRIPARRQRRTDFKEFLLGPSLCERMSEGNTHEKYKVEETEDVFGAGSATIGHHFEIVFVDFSH